MIKTIEIKAIIGELKPILRPNPQDVHQLNSLDSRYFGDVNRIKAFFKLLKKQKIESVLLDTSNTNEIKIIFNSGCSEYTLFNRKAV